MWQQSPERQQSARLGTGLLWLEKRQKSEHVVGSERQFQKVRGFVSVWVFFLSLFQLLHDAGIFYPGIEVGGNLAQADGGVAPDWALFVSGLQSCKVTHQLLVQVGLVEFRSQQQHGLKQVRTKKTNS